jgi:L-fuconolactonase
VTPAGGSGPVDAHVHVASDDEARFPRHPTGLASDWWKRGGYDVDAVLGTLAGARVAQMVVVQAAGAYMAVRPTAAWVGTERADRAFASAGRAGLTVVLTVSSIQIPALRPVMDRFPEVPIILDHCAFPTLKGSVIRRDDPLLGLIDLPQVAVKVTSHNLAPLAQAGGGRSLVEQLAGCFGTARILWGSDYPQTAHDTYAGLVDLARTALAGLSPAEQSAVLGDNTRRLFGFADRDGGPNGPYGGP